ncbi:FtsX-like permease family protein [Hyphomicrobium sp.]|uniref:ABC transporter permease n=1 Tax=Hyphomicrobium sp. TaxID=82 RepID=UPI0025C08AFC|nr:FtsX-like permease family protein [Hyphomicrobium sp.]MCC7252754.1 FtsX-like permease family protein [Hyphomicrobium sp.]
MTAVAEVGAGSARPRTGLPLSRLLGIALSELRAGLNGFYIFIACVALGVAVIATVGTLSDALRSGFERQGEIILGGDATFSRMHTRATDAERSWLEARGRVSESAAVRTMARRLDGEEQALIEIKAVDSAYPLAGAVEVHGAPFADAMAAPDGAVVDPVLLSQLGLSIGDRMRVGETEVTVKATLVSEPDAVADRLTYGPRVFVSHATLDKTGLVQPGTLVRWRYALKLNPDTAPVDLAQFRATAKADLAQSGFVMADRRDPSPQVTRTLDRLRQFLTFLGLAALLVGGVGIASAVATFIERRRNVIATMKTVGATSRLVLMIFLVQVLAIALIGVALGLAVGLTAPHFLITAYGDQLPIKAELTFSLTSILASAAYGVLVALLFTLWPLGRAELIKPSVLFRDEVAPERVWPRRGIIAATAFIAAMLLAFVLTMAESTRIALYFCGALVLVFLVFTALGSLVTVLARRVPRPKWPELALAIGNLGAPGGLTRSVVVSLGAGLSLLVAVALADASLVEELTSRLPKKAPSHFLLDVPKADAADLIRIVEREAPGAHVVEAPMLRGRLIELNGRKAEEVKLPPEAQWVLNGDRGLTYADTLPEGSTLVEGQWWPADYTGEPLVSFERDLAGHLGIAIGDTVTVNVLGRNLTARIANLREVKWESLRLNFVMVFSPNALAAAPHNLLATVSLPDGVALETEAELGRAIGKAFPSVTVIRVKDALEAVNAILSKVMVAVRVAGAVTLVAGALVLAGALATAQRRRVLEAVVLKVLGATRRRVLTSHALEYLMLAVIAGLFAAALGAFAAWIAVSEVMRIPFTFSVPAVLRALALAIGLVLLFGSLGTWAILRAKPAAILRSE